MRSKPRPGRASDAGERATGMAARAPVRWFETFAVVATLALAAGCVLWDVVDRPSFTRHLKQEHSGDGAGVVEHLTFLVLLPGIVAGAWAWTRRARLPDRLLGVWVLAWTLACVYFAGEEVSWGYWAFGWETPAAIAELNDQGETNLHNMTSWLDQKPRALVELFVMVAGMALPLARRLGWRRPLLPGARLQAMEPWLVAPLALLPAGLFFTAIRIAKYLPERAFDNLGDSELRELAIAWFLALYLASWAVRLRRETAPGAGAAATG